ncbi:MAG: PASTA domain-containing protein [Ignavibacteria bacterium]|nr:PASTA domain-containing protein [Ignavibacteria bacterium]
MKAFKGLYPYLIVLAVFVLTLIITVVIVNSFILPTIIGKKSSVKLPNLIGKEIESAKSILKQNSLEVDKITEQYNDNYPAGIVINQIPKPFQFVKEGRAITLIVSKGGETLTVPYLVGKPLRNARIDLMNLGLSIGEIAYEYSESFGGDTIISQKISSGKQVPYGSSVDVVVSKGAELMVVVPQLNLLPLEEATKILLESKLQVGNITYVKNETFQPNTVINQNPSAGELLNENSFIDLTVTK